jgi:hypothetical protein
MRTVTALVIAAALAGCTLQDTGGANRQKIFGAVSKYDLLDMGAQQLSGEEITVALAGKTFVEPNQGWTWQIDADGHQQAQAKDGSWADPPGGTWKVKDGQFCRKTADIKERCSDVYRIGPFYRMTAPDGSLATWTITEG